MFFFPAEGGLGSNDQIFLKTIKIKKVSKRGGGEGGKDREGEESSHKCLISSTTTR